MSFRSLQVLRGRNTIYVDNLCAADPTYCHFGRFLTFGKHVIYGCNTN